MNYIKSEYRKEKEARQANLAHALTTFTLCMIVLAYFVGHLAGHVFYIIK